MLYEIIASRVTARTDGHGVTWSALQQIPTFFLDSGVQGIRSAEHAEQIARDILAVDGATVYVSVYPSQFIRQLAAGH